MQDSNNSKQPGNGKKRENITELLSNRHHERDEREEEDETKSRHWPIFWDRKG